MQIFIVIIYTASLAVAVNLQVYTWFPYFKEGFNCSRIKSQCIVGSGTTGSTPVSMCSMVVDIINCVKWKMDACMYTSNCQALLLWKWTHTAVFHLKIMLDSRFALSWHVASFEPRLRSSLPLMLLTNQDY